MIPTQMINVVRPHARENANLGPPVVGSPTKISTGGPIIYALNVPSIGIRENSFPVLTWSTPLHRFLHREKQRDSIRASDILKNDRGFK